MAKSKEKIGHDSSQLSLFDILSKWNGKAGGQQSPSPASFNMDLRLREELSLGLKRSPQSRYQIAARMSELTGMEISKSQLDSWTAESKENHRFPAAYLPAFCEATGDKEPLKFMAEMLNCYLIESHDALLTELGRIKQTKESLAEKERTIRRVLKEMGK